MIVNRTDDCIFSAGETIAVDDCRPFDGPITCEPITTIAYLVQEKRISLMTIERLIG